MQLSSLPGPHRKLFDFDAAVRDTDAGSFVENVESILSLLDANVCIIPSLWRFDPFWIDAENFQTSTPVVVADYDSQSRVT